MVMTNFNDMEMNQEERVHMTIELVTAKVITEAAHTNYLSVVGHWTGDRVVLGSNPAAATSLRNFWQFRLPRFASVFLRRH